MSNYPTRLDVLREGWQAIREMTRLWLTLQPDPPNDDFAHVEQDTTDYLSRRYAEREEERP